MRPDKDDVRRGAEGPLKFASEEPLLMDVHRRTDRAALILAYQTGGWFGAQAVGGRRVVTAPTPSCKASDGRSPRPHSAAAPAPSGCTQEESEQTAFSAALSQKGTTWLG